jgi:protein-tyrosine phosphatase
MANKIWEATDLIMGRMGIEKLQNADGETCIQIIQNYKFLDSDENILENLGNHKIQELRTLSTVPASILSALNTIQNYMYDKALEQEQMNES